MVLLWYYYGRKYIFMTKTVALNPKIIPIMNNKKNIPTG